MNPTVVNTGLYKGYDVKVKGLYGNKDFDTSEVQQVILLPSLTDKEQALVQQFLKDLKGDNNEESTTV